MGGRGRSLVLPRLVANLVASLDKRVRNQLFKTLESRDPEDRFFQDQNFSQDFGKFGTFLT